LRVDSSDWDKRAEWSLNIAFGGGAGGLSQNPKLTLWFGFFLWAGAGIRPLVREAHSFVCYLEDTRSVTVVRDIVAFDRASSGCSGSSCVTPQFGHPAGPVRAERDARSSHARYCRSECRGDKATRYQRPRLGRECRRWAHLSGVARALPAGAAAHFDRFPADVVAFRLGAPASRSDSSSFSALVVKVGQGALGCRRD
jgi:hypothetical protein